MKGLAKIKMEKQEQEGNSLAQVQNMLVQVLMVNCTETGNLKVKSYQKDIAIKRLLAYHQNFQKHLDQS